MGDSKTSGRFGFANVLLRVFAVSTALSCAVPRPPLTLFIGRGDDVSRVVERHAEEIHAYLAQDGRYSSYAAGELARHLLRSNSPMLLLEVSPGNQLVIQKDGQMALIAGRGAPPRAPKSSERLKASMEDLFHEASEEIHERALKLATEEGVSMGVFSIGDDGKSLTVGEQTFAAGTGVEFQGRRGHFHVVGRGKSLHFDVPVWPIAGVRFSFPRNPYFYLAPDDRVEMKSDAEATVAWLVGEGQLLAHEERFSLTRSFDFEPWQALRRFADSEKTPTMRRELAKQVEVALLSEALQIDPDDPSRSLADLKLRLTRIWKAIEADMSGPELTFIVAHNAEIAADGKLLYIGRQLLSTAEGLRFTLCKHHIHVVGNPRLGINVAVPPPVADEPLRISDHAILQMQGDRFELRKMSNNLISMLEKRQIAAREHTYHITEQYFPEAFAELRSALDDGRVKASVRHEAKQVIEEALAVELPLDSERRLMATLGGLWRRLRKAQTKVAKYR